MFSKISKPFLRFSPGCQWGIRAVHSVVYCRYRDCWMSMRCRDTRWNLDSWRTRCCSHAHGTPHVFPVEFVLFCSLQRRYAGRRYCDRVGVRTRSRAYFAISLLMHRQSTLGVPMVVETSLVLMVAQQGAWYMHISPVPYAFGVGVYMLHWQVYPSGNTGTKHCTGSDTYRMHVARVQPRGRRYITINILAVHSTL